MDTNRHCHLVAAGACVFVMALMPLVVRAGNLLPNGSFDHPDDPRFGWTYDYRDTGNALYAGNRENVSVIPRDGTRRNVLRLYGTRHILWELGQGTKVDSVPIPYEQGARYRLSAFARAQGDTSKGAPNCRIYIEGYQWKPGVKPYENPSINDLRRVYKQGAGNILYFGNSKSGPFSNPSGSWQRGENTFPGTNLSDLARSHLRRVEFMVVHIVAIDGWDGAILVDDVELRRIE